MKRFLHKIGLHFWQEKNPFALLDVRICLICNKEKVVYHAPIQKGWLER